MPELCVCGHREEPHLDEGGENIWCLECWYEADYQLYPCSGFVARVPGWEYMR